MKRLTVWALLALCVLATTASSESHAANAQAAPRAAWPLQLEMRVPYEPTAFPSAGHTYLMYELYFTNFGTAPVTLRRIDVLDADTAAAQPIAAFEGAQLDALLQPIGAQPAANANTDRHQIAASETIVAFMAIALDRAAHVPNTLLHRVVTADATTEGAAIGTHHTTLHVLGAPVAGGDWLASDGPSNGADNHHRRGIFLADGRVEISRRYAIDWMRVKNGAMFSGNERDVHSYYAYAQPVLAVADSIVVAARDGLPDNVPGHNADFHPAVPITPATVDGNTITLDLGGGQFAHYMHLEPGSPQVKAGDHVRRGQIIARVGSSGDARAPHLHIQITTSARSGLDGEGMPYLIDTYRVVSGSDSAAGQRTHELPLDGMVVDFGQQRRK